MLRSKADLPLCQYGAETLVQQTFVSRRQKGHKTVLLASDIDNTFMIEAPGRIILPDSLIRFLERESIALAFITGGSVESVAERITQGILPPAAVIAGCVGTQLWVRTGDKPHKREAWFAVPLPTGRTIYYVQDTRFAFSPAMLQYDRREMVVRGRRFIEIVNQHDAGRPSIEQYCLAFQRPDEEKRFLVTGKTSRRQDYKVSFHFFASSVHRAEEVRWQAERWFKTRAIMCEEIGYGHTIKGNQPKKYCLDILATAKADAANYIIQASGPDYTVVAGDSGNDLDMLTQSGDAAIVVGGARDELLEPLAAFLKLDQTAAPLLSVRGKRYYIENENRLGPQSIEYALQLLNLHN